MKWLRRMALAFGGVLVLAAGFVGFCALSYWQHQRIDESRGIDESGYVKIGGTEQWVQIRGDDRNNPVLLWLNGGPGFTTIGDTFWYRSWERNYTVVMWDQRGEGKSFDRTGPSVKETMTIAQFTKDGTELAEYLARRLNQRKIILLGHSWGSLLGVHMVQARPELFSAFVATGELVSQRENALTSYPQVLERARLRGNKQAEQELLRAGPPPYSEDIREWIPLLTWAQVLDPVPRETQPFSAAALWWQWKNRIARRQDLAPGITRATQFTMVSLWPEVVRDDVRSLGLRFEIPVAFIQGAEDITTPTSLAKSYFDQIDAPSKHFVVLPRVGHLAIFTDREAFLRALNEHAR